MRRSAFTAIFFLLHVAGAFHVNIVDRIPVASSTRWNHEGSRVRMGISPLPQPERVQKAVISAMAAFLIALNPQHALAAETITVQESAPAELSPAQMLVQKTTDTQRERLKDEERRALERDSKMEEGDLIARVIVSIKAELYELGAPDISGFPELDTDQARLIIAAFGKDGPPVAAKRLTVKGRDFPVVIELTADDLAFPLTKAAWKKDARSQQEIALAVEIDPDGKAATLDSESLSGYGVSKPIVIGGQPARTEARVQLMPNPMLKEKADQMLPPEAVEQLDRVDALLDFKEANSASKTTMTTTKAKKASKSRGF